METVSVSVIPAPSRLCNMASPIFISPSITKMYTPVFRPLNWYSRSMPLSSSAQENQACCMMEISVSGARKVEISLCFNRGVMS